MKRGILPILMLLLVMDLADDGCFGKAEFVPPHSHAKISLNSFPQSDSGCIGSSAVLPLSQWRGIPSLREPQLIRHMSQLLLMFMNICNNGSSGGIPR
jgi:hypothetical protein